MQNMVRKATRPDYYTPDILEGDTEDRLIGPRHITHCIDAIRQSLMCASDISVYTVPGPFLCSSCLIIFSRTMVDSLALALDRNCIANAL